MSTQTAPLDITVVNQRNYDDVTIRVIGGKIALIAAFDVAPKGPVLKVKMDNGLNLIPGSKLIVLQEIRNYLDREIARLEGGAA